MQFLHFKLCQTAVFEPLDLWTGYIHVLKALKVDKLTQYLKIGVEGENIWPSLYVNRVILSQDDMVYKRLSHSLLSKVQMVMALGFQKGRYELF